MKTIRILLIWVVAIPVLTGCWDRIEVNDIAIVTAAGIDLGEDNRIRLSLQVAIPTKLGPTSSAGGATDNSTFVVSETGVTIAEAYRHIQAKISRRIFFSHSRVLLIGEKLAKKGVSHIVDFYSRFHQPRMNSYIMYTKGEAFEVIKNKPQLENVSAEETRELTKLNVGVKVNISEFLDMLFTDGVEPVAPQFVLEPLEAGLENESQSGQAINGAALFKKDKLIGWMNDKESRGILWLRNNMQMGVITVNVAKEKGGGHISSNIIRSNTDIVPEHKQGKLKATVNLTTEMVVMENSSDLNLNDSKIIEYLQKELETEIKDRIQLTLGKAQKEYETDIFGFGEAVYKKYPKEWNEKYKKEWDQEFPNLEVSIKPQVFVRRTGLTK
ncbi:Ger(x)C family spore germination protein [Metabacillus arenae]|uniref:Ger(X)C family spore germination protein n=1 Tax=Metabacillus arenae TaxID=2771434 RepID=A0A926NIU8_9BACI|nr:Ger(x)C family spore germination protein [Metabacillus arenae]MBD1382509.1 Ger(x)C family spore germination protein [Metabacillus arenae]